MKVDVSEPNHALKHLTRICILADLTLMLAWSYEDAGRIIETYKIFEYKPPEMIMERGDTNPQQKVNQYLDNLFDKYLNFLKLYCSLSVHWPQSDQSTKQTRWLCWETLEQSLIFWKQHPRHWLCVLVLGFKKPRDCTKFFMNLFCVQIPLQLNLILDYLSST